MIFFSRLRIPFRKDECVFLGLVALYVFICASFSFSRGFQDNFHPVMYLETGAVMTAGIAVICLLLLALRAYYIILFIRPPRLADHLSMELKGGPLNTERYLRAFPVFTGLVFFLSAFTSMKQMIPDFQPFIWDEFFARLDHTLHFGVDPWRLLQPVIGYPLVTWAINLVYNAWLPALFAALYWQMFSLRDPLVRMQFFYSFVLGWAVNGTLLAILLSSAGPCFFERLTGSDYFAPLMDYLRQTHEIIGLFAVTTQDTLWQASQGGHGMTGGGISAMPSIHVTTALIFLLTALKLKLKAWPLFALFFAIILIGSVHLGWHYAVDGYLAIITTLLIWHGAGKLSRVAT